MNEELFDKLEKEEMLTTSNSYYVELYQALDRLYKNPDFKKVILDGFLTEKVHSAAMMMSKPGVNISLLLEESLGANILRDYFNTIVNMAGSDLLAEEEK